MQTGDIRADGLFAAADVHYGRPARAAVVAAAGIGIQQAARLVRDMAGPFRLPDALRRADALARGNILPRA